MLLSLSRIRWWGEKKPNRGEGDCSQLLEKLFVHSHSWWRLSTHPLRTNFNNWVQLMPLCKFSDCVLSVCVPPRILVWLMDFCRFSRNMWEMPVFRAGSSGLCLGTLAGQNPVAKKNYLVSVPSSLVYNDTLILCIIHGQLDELGQQFWWSFELGCHGHCSLHQCSNSFLAKNFHPCVLSLCSMVAFVLGQRSRPGESAGSQS